MPPEELTLILKLRDEATAQLKSVRGTVTAIGGAMIATGLKVGAEWATATKTIVDGTGATGPALKQLQTDFQAVAKHGAAPAATAIADLNTHLGLSGPELQIVADQALKLGVNTSSLGGVLEQTGGDVDDYRQFIDDLAVAAQGTGVSAEQLLDTVSKNSARWQAGGGDVNDLMAHVVTLAQEFGPKGLRGAMSETMAEVDTGVIPTVTSLRDQLGETTGAVERTYEASYTWRDAIGEAKNAAIAYLGPAGDMLAGVGAMAVGLVQIVPLIKNTAIVQKALNLVMSLNPLGLVLAAIGLLVAAYVTWKDQINAFLVGAWNKFVGAIEGAINFLRPLADFIGIELPEDLGSWKTAQEEATEAVEAAEPVVVELDTAAVALAATVSTEVVPAMEAFDLSTANVKNQLQQAKPEIRDIGDLLEASGVQAGAAVLPWGFFADEVSVKVPNAMDIVMDSMMELPPTADEVAQNLRTAAPTWGQNMLDGLGSVFSADNVGGILSRAFEGGGGLLGAAKSFGSQLATSILSGIPGGGIIAGLLPAAGKLLGKLFGGPSEAVVAARESMGAYASTIEADTLNQDRLKDWTAGGFSPDHAAIVTQFQDLAEASGVGAQAGVDIWLQYQKAVEDGNQAGIDAVFAQVDAWTAASAEINASVEASNQDRIESELAALDETHEARVAAIEMMKEAEIGANKARLEELLAGDQRNGATRRSRSWRTTRKRNSGCSRKQTTRPLLRSRLHVRRNWPRFRRPETHSSESSRARSSARSKSRRSGSSSPTIWRRRPAIWSYKRS